ncbi:MAG: hypothetical protein MUO78_01860 [candidate division Zixibacteria bacterium]|nr:hypothetical protein [candidate division Zixibacteria bacterium]
MKKGRQHTVENRQGEKLDRKLHTVFSRQVKIFFLICCLLSTIYCLLPSAFPEINNTLAYSVSHTQSTTANRLGPVSEITIAQTILATTDETWYGIVVYLDRNGFSSSTDSVKLRFSGIQSPSCGTPDTSLTTKRDVYVKVTDIPDGDATNNTIPPDSIARGYAIWFIFDTPVYVGLQECYTIFLNGPYTDANNRINWFYGTNGYTNGSAWYQTTGSWTNYNSDMDFRVIKDKYALIAVRRLPFNTKGVLTINSDMDGASVDYLDSLHRWLNTNQNVGGSWGQGLNGKIAGNEVWFGRGSVVDSLGTYNKDVPFYFHGLDTTLTFYKDTVDNYISRRWADGNHSYGDCGWDGADPTCMDSTHVKKFLNYMLNRPSVFGRLYKGGLWVYHGSQHINIFCDDSQDRAAFLGDSSQTVYYHTNKTLASGRFKFCWSSLTDPGTSSKQLIPYSNWFTLQDSLNIKDLPFTNRALRDNTKTYKFQRIGRSAAGTSDSLYKFFNRSVAKQCVDSNWISLVYTHLGKDGGLDQDDRDSIKAVYDSAESWSLWIPSTKALFNQQCASGFAQVTVDRPANSKRRVNIKSLYDWSWGSHIPDREEVYYLTFIAYTPESLIITINGTDTLPDSNMTNQQDVPANYNDAGASSSAKRTMSWVGMYNRTAGRKIVVPPSEATTSQRKRTAVIEQLLSLEDKKK